MADPGDNNARLNNANLTLVTHLALDDNPADGNYDVSNFLTTIDDSTSTIKGHVKVSRKFDTATYALYTISGVTDTAPNWFDVEVAYVSGNGTFTDGEELLFTFARTGDVGAQGVQGEQGTQGLQGEQGTQGTQGVQGETGTQGVQGEQGTQGTQGVQGETGTQGTEGLQGFDGTQGVQGISGTADTYAANITPEAPFTATTFAITHSFGTKDVLVTVWDSVADTEVVTDITKTNTNTVTIGFAVAPASGETYRVVVKQ
jgi:hypothetical protein